MNYVIVAGLSGLFFVLIDLIYKFTGCSTLSPSYFVSVWWIMGGFFALIYFLYNGYYTKHLDLNLFLLISGLGLLTFIGNIIYLISVKKVTNPGLSRAAFSGTLILVATLISSLIFKKYISLEKIFAIICILLGITILLNSD
jgi:uncharacterized membrane protein